MRVHFIAIGGAAMHNMAIALKRKGFDVTGSDDKIFDPSKSRLEKEGLLPEQFGWDEARISHDLDAIILGMHARKDNPELLRAQQLGVRIYSYPEYLFEQSKEKTRVVIGGSHGKTSITAMILHVLHKLSIECDYMVGAQLDGFDCMVKLSEAKIIVLEGDEYLSSPIDRRPKFHLYRPHVALLSGVAWDHINVFPTFEGYVDQFKLFAGTIEKNGSLVFYEGDQNLQSISSDLEDVSTIPYDTHEHEIENGISILVTDNGNVPLEIFGRHNLQNLNGARSVCREIGVNDEDFYRAISSFKGAARRLELLKRTHSSVAYKDFAHSPSKLKATTSSLKEQYPDRELVACMELHTFSSLNKEFLSEYRGSMDKADRALVYFDPEVVSHKRLQELDPQEVEGAFGKGSVEVFTDVTLMLEELRKVSWMNKNLLIMTSGNLKGTNIDALVDQLIV